MNDLLGFYPKLARQGIFKGVDLKPLVARLWRLESMHVDGRMAPPAVRWRACKHSMRSAAWVRRGPEGNAKEHRIVISLWPTEIIGNAIESLLHELVHCSFSRREAHSELFCRRLIACAREGFGLDLDTATLLSLKAVGGCIAYAIDNVITDALMAADIGTRLREDPETRFEPAPVEDPAIVAARVAAARAEGQTKATAAREAHAREKLLEWESRLARTKRVALKWRTKVRYYDRRAMAAKRGAS